MKSIVRMVAVATAVVALGVHADNDDDFDLDGASATSEEAGEAVSDEEAGEAVSDDDEGAADGSDVKVPKIQERVFYTLPFCRRLEGSAEVMLPGQTAWTPVEEGKYYPLGARYRTIGAESRLTIKFGIDAEVIVRGEGSFVTQAKPLGEKSRAINLAGGTIQVNLPSELKEGLFSVNAPGFKVTNLSGKSRYTYNKTVDGDEAIVRCVTQTMSVEGLHFKAPALRAANEIRIRTSNDELVTSLYGSRGDILVRLDQGLVENRDFGTGESKVEPKFLDWKLSPRTSVRIHRMIPTIGENMAVTMMTFDARGELRNRCAFTENMYNVNSGELGPTSKKEREALAKRAAEISKSQEASEAADETSDVDVGESDKDSSEAAAEDSSGSASGDDDLEF